jgi:pimeloyl-ACP methyl ester carboxylesterase
MGGALLSRGVFRAPIFNLSVARADVALAGELGLFMQVFDYSYVRSFVTMFEFPSLESSSDRDINKSAILRLLTPVSADEPRDMACAGGYSATEKGFRHLERLATSRDTMIRIVALAVLMTALTAPAVARVVPYPAGFRTQMVETNGTSLYVRVGGMGPAVVLLHGFGDTGDMWAPLAAVLAKDHTVIVPDLRGMGLSAHPDTGYTKKNQAMDIAGVMDALKVQKADLVTHDIGNMVGFALAAQFPARIARWVVIDAPLPGIGDWENIIRSPLLWHFNFRGPDEERLVQGRERIYLDRFWDELSADPKGIDEQTRRHYASLYARPQAIHDAFEQFGAFSQDAIDNKALLAKGGKLAFPVLAVGAEKSSGKGMADIMAFVATNVTGAIVPKSGHWIMEENPQATVKLVTDFLAK